MGNDGFQPPIFMGKLGKFQRHPDGKFQGHPDFHGLKMG